MLKEVEEGTKQRLFLSRAQQPADHWGDVDGQIVHQRPWKSSLFFQAEAVENLAQILFWKSSPRELKNIQHIEHPFKNRGKRKGNSLQKCDEA